MGRTHSQGQVAERESAIIGLQRVEPDRSVDIKILNLDEIIWRDLAGSCNSRYRIASFMLVIMLVTYA